MTEIVMLVWLGDVAHNVSFLLGLLLVGCVLAAAVMWVLADFYNFDCAHARRLAWPVAVGATISALALALIPSRDTIYLYAGNYGTRGRSVRCAAALAA